MPIPTVSRERALAYAAVLLVVLVVAGRYAVGGGEPQPAGGAATASELVPEEAPQPLLVVHVVGAVQAPGLYRLAEGSRVDDAIREAGGAKPRAALELVNLAAPVADGQQVTVPVSGRAGPTAASGVAAAGAPVHLNTATLEELDALPGIGPVTAQQILDYREERGAFSSIEELDAVPGIGPARLEQLRELVQL